METVDPEVSHAELADIGGAKEFILAGRAVFTAKSDVTGNHVTFKVTRSHDEKVYFVNVREKGDGDGDYVYVGLVNAETEQFYFARKYHNSRYPKDGAIPGRVFDYVWRGVKQYVTPPHVRLFHEGRCGRCSRRLTHPNSIISGIGPECAKKIQGG